MPRYIDADAFKEIYGNYYAEEGTAQGFIGTIGQLIDNAPTVEEISANCMNGFKRQVHNLNIKAKNGRTET